MGQGSVTVVGLGPGDERFIAPDVMSALQSCTTIAGYKGYIEQVPPHCLAEKRIIQSGMMGEMERCNQALDAAAQGERVVLVCSGDAGVYALAGLVLELAHARWGDEQPQATLHAQASIDSHVCLHGQESPLTQASLSAQENSLSQSGSQNTAIPQIEILPGIPALAAAASLLGAPLTHDFACISLSDLLTPWETIEKRISCALEGDFVLVVYNPRSRKRDWQLSKLMELALEKKDGATPVGLVRQAYRKDQDVSVHTLQNFDVELVDMLSILFIGNSQTKILRGQFWQRAECMVTPRGYFGKYEENGAKK